MNKNNLNEEHFDILRAIYIEKNTSPLPVVSLNVE